MKINRNAVTKPVKTPKKFLKPQVNDYVIGDDGKKRWLLQVTSVSPEGSVYGHLDKDRAYKPKTAEFRPDQIVAVLGPDPMLGSAFGVMIEPYLRSLVHKDWGDVHFYFKLKSEVQAQLKSALDEVAKKLKAKRLFGFVKAGNMAMEIRQPKGKWDGMYHFKPTKEGGEDRMALRPKGINQMNYVLAHESGHGVWYRMMTRKAHARWIKLYKSYMKAQAFSDKDIVRLRDDYIKDSVRVKDFKGQLEEADAILFDNLIHTMVGSTRLTIRHLDLLAETGDLEVIKDQWPTHADDSDFDVAISEYGTTSPEELFAEAFAFWILGNKIPSVIANMMEKTIANCKIIETQVTPE